MRTLTLLLLSVAWLNAAAYTVKSGGGGNYATIQACATAMTAGDTCTVYAGTYNENVTVSAGTPGNYKTIQVNSADACSPVGFGSASPTCGVIVNSFSMGSHTKVTGFKVTSGTSTSCVSVGSSTDVYVIGNYLTQCAGYHGGIVSIGTGSYVYVQRNTLSWSDGNPSTSTVGGHGITASNANHILVEQNDLSHYILGITFSATNSIFRNNSFHDQIESESGEHTDIIFSEPASSTTPSHYNLAEGNVQRNATGPNAKSFLAQGDGCAGACSNLIIRYNDIAHTGSGVVVDDNAQNSSVIPGYHHVKVYNNTFVDVVNTGSPLSAEGGNYGYNSTSPTDINNIYYWPAAVPVLNAYASDASTDSTFTYGHDLAYCGGGSCSGLKGHRYNQGSFAADPGNIVADPHFLSYSGNDFHVQSGSPVIGAGTYLTTVAASDSGAGTSLVVADAAYFQDGYELTGVSPDCIAVGTASNHVCLTAVNYATNTLTLSAPITRSAGQGIYLFSKSDGVQVLTGAAPDIGAYPFTTSGGSGTLTPPPTSTTVVH